MSRRPAASLLLVALACASRNGESLVAQPISGGREWVSPRHRDHPLVGRIWDARGGQWVEEPALEAAVRGAPFVLLGETHDNPDHHLLQARMVRAVAASGRRPALALEMLDVDDQAAIDASVAKAPLDAGALGKAVEWDRSGWPKYSQYRPILEAGLAAGMPIVAANLPRPVLRKAVFGGAAELPADVRERIERAGPPSEAERASLRKEMQESHCGDLPEDQLDPMILAQRARDAQMAGRMLSAGAADGAVLIAGKGHTRVDRGVPAFLAREAPGRGVVSVAFVEVEPGLLGPNEYARDYSVESLPFDFVVFTPATKREDPCEKFRSRPKETTPATSQAGDGDGGTVASGSPARRAPAAG